MVQGKVLEIIMALEISKTSFIIDGGKIALSG